MQIDENKLNRVKDSLMHFPQLLGIDLKSK